MVLYAQIDLFQEGIQFLGLRFEEAASIEGNPIEAYFHRYWVLIKAPLSYCGLISLELKGLGSATRAGSALAAKFGIYTSIGFVETAWSQPIIENGLIIGGTFIIWRIWVTKDLLRLSLNAVKQGNYLPIFYSVLVHQFYSQVCTDNLLH